MRVNHELAQFAVAGAFLWLGVQSATAHDAVMAPSEAAPFGNPIDDQHIWVHGVLDQFEGRFGDNSSTSRWQGELWAGTDMNRLRFKSEGEWSRRNRFEDGQQEIYYSRPISRYFDAQIGGRYDLDSASGRAWGAFGIEGLAPMFFHVSANAYVSDRGHYAAKLEGSYDLLITQRLILQPEFEMNLYTKEDSSRGIGSGLSDIDTGLRLRYEITRKFAPYIGVTYARKFGDTAQFSRNDGEQPDALRFTVGLRVWF